jgi:hypothetical protein
MNVDTIINCTDEPLGKLYSWLPHDLTADTVVFFPDACPGKAPLPTGTAVRTSDPDWRRLALSDCGCGMRLVKTEHKAENLSLDTWNALANRLHAEKGGLGDLGGGNHFVDALAGPDGQLFLLIHTGSRHESRTVEDLVDTPAVFDREFDRVVRWAADNRAAVNALAERVLGRTELVLDLPHNTYETLAGGGAIIRKGSAKVEPGGLNIIPAHLDDEVALVRATDRVADVLASMSHGTGRVMARSEAKRIAPLYDFDALHDRVLIPDRVSNASLRTDGPFAYRDLEPCLRLLDPYIEEVVERFRVIGYMGHL